MLRRAVVCRQVLAVLCGSAAGLLGRAAAVRAQQPPRDTVRVVAGAHYGASGLHQFFFGRYYRDLWTAPLEVEVLNLALEAGGLTPTTAGRGFQTKSLRFRGADGYQYSFRSVDKDPAVLPPELEGTIVEDLVRDQTSSQHPAGPAVVTPLLEAAAIPRTLPRLVQLPDDARLGPFRERFAGTLGFFERRATLEAGVPPFAGAAEIIESDELQARTERSSRDQLDLAAFAYARLFDLFIGDWDRHRGQWSFLRYDSGSTTRWIPLPEDRDQAFVRFDGFMLWLARQYAPFLPDFTDHLPAPAKFAWNGRDLDRRYLPRLEQSVWDSVASALAARLTDSAIDRAVRGLPPEYYALDGAQMARALKARRPQLQSAARRWYRLLAAQPDVHATDETELILIDRRSDGSTDLAIFAEPTPGQVAAAPHWQRRFRRGETEEIRLFLHGGGDRVVVRGSEPGISLRVVGTGGATVVDSSGTGGVHLYSTEGDVAIGHVSVDRRPFVLPPKKRPNELPPRDWGQRWRSILWAGYGPDLGVFVGEGAYVTHYGFRKLPYASKLLFRVGFSTGAMTGRADLSGEFYRRNSRVRWLLAARASGIEILWYNGLGNETELVETKDYYRVNQAMFQLDPALVLPLGKRGDFTIGPSLTYAYSREQEGRILADSTLYGENGFGQVGVAGRIEFDTRDVRAAATRGLHVLVGGRYYPAWWDVDSAFGEVHGEASTYLTAAPLPFRPTLALRAGGKKVWGRYPFQEAAYLGDSRSVRLGHQNRYGGDAAVYGNAELRLQLARIFLVLPAQFGIFGLGDVGRVYLKGESSDAWHWAAGGGIWIAFLGPANTVSLAVAQSSDRLAVYAKAGFAF